MYTYTEHEYEALLIAVASRWTPLFFHEAMSSVSYGVLWRHDIDCSAHRALALAQIEKRHDVKATYFFHFHNEGYSLLEKEISGIARRISGLGHAIGLHFDMEYYADSVCNAVDIERYMVREQALLEDIAGCSVNVFSFHNPTLMESIQGFDMQADMIAGMYNASGRAIASQYIYASDSRGGWRRRDLPALVAQGTATHMHVLTHPERWTPTPLTPRGALMRAIDGRHFRQRDQIIRLTEYWEQPIDESADKANFERIVAR